MLKHTQPSMNKVFCHQTIGLRELVKMSSLALLIFIIPILTQAQTAECGDFIYMNDDMEERYPIEDCEDPFGLSYAGLVKDFNFTIDDNVLNEGEVREVASLPATIVLPQSEILSEYDNSYFVLYRHEEDDYRFVDEDYTNNPSEIIFTINATGTYSIVTSFNMFPVLMLNEESWWQKVLAKFIPVAQAQYLPTPVMGLLTFTLTTPPPPPTPTGASSVLFLPGIMGSRLYEDGSFCEETITKHQLWFSFNECKQLRLTTKFTGQSNNPIYTKPGAPGILDETLTLNIYKKFISELEDWKDSEIIADYTVVPYDWRAELDNILKSGIREQVDKIFAGEEASIVAGNLYNLIEELAISSKNGKVTVVAHSNGGLVIKQLISNLKNTNDQLLDKIDNVILVAVPQLGAPNSAFGILHGEDLDPVMSQAVTRQLMNTMPFSHHLLPVNGYFDTVDNPLITIEPGDATNDWINNFEASISSQSDLHDFLSVDSGREKPAFADLAKPEIVDNYLLNYAKTAEVVQRNFAPTTDMKVYQIAGIGLETPSSLTYFSDQECTKRSFFLCTEYSPKISYRVNMTIDGDNTVPVPSALALEKDQQVEMWWLDLPSYNSAGLFGSSNLNRKHKDIFEVPDVINFVFNTIQATNTLAYNYLSDTEPTLAEGERLVFQLHSPLDMSVVDSNGKVVSSSTIEIENSVYRRFGELQYLSIPADVNATLLLSGLAEGSFTLDIEEVAGEEIIRHTYSAIPSSTSTQVSLAIQTNVALGNALLEIDYNGDGEDDVLYSTAGIVTEEITYEDLFAVINHLGLKKAPKIVLLSLATVAEKFHDKAVKNSKYRKQEEATLNLLLKQVFLFEKIKLINKAQKDEIESVIIELLNK